MMRFIKLLLVIVFGYSLSIICADSTYACYFHTGKKCCLLQDGGQCGGGCTAPNCQAGACRYVFGTAPNHKCYCKLGALPPSTAAEPEEAPSPDLASAPEDAL